MILEMPNVGELLSALDAVAPPHLALPDDPIGLQVGRKGDPVDACLAALDPSPSALRRAVEIGAQAIVSHHALIYHPIRTLAGDAPQVHAIRLALQNRIAVLIAHTNWDAAAGGVNDTLATKLGLEEIRPFGNDVPQRRYKLVTFLPPESRDAVLDALAGVGCGEIGLYRRCAFYSAGTGTYEPQEGASPLIGEVGQRETAAEERVEALVPGHAMQAAIRALKQTHPYDEPAYDLYPIEAMAASLPRMGDLPEPMSFAAFSSYAAERLATSVRSFGKSGAMIGSVGVVGGAGGSYWLRAKVAGCDALVTGEVKHHEAVEAAESGFCVIEAGHFATEQPSVYTLAERLESLMPGVRFETFAPPQGESGSPI